MEFDTPAYAHSGIGTITYDTNDYLGVGDFGSVSSTKESEELGPSGITLQLSGVDSTLITTALDSGKYGDVVTLYVGYRQDDGTLVDDPWVLWRGTFEYASIGQGESNVVSITLQHDLAILDEADGGRYTDEDQQSRFAGDRGFEYVAEMGTVKLLWGGKPVVVAGGGSVKGAGDRPPQSRD